MTREKITPRESVSKERSSRFEIKTSDEARAYRQWKDDVPAAFRRIVEAALLGKTPSDSAINLPRVDAFFNALKDAFTPSYAVVSQDDSFGVNDFVQSLRSIKTNAGNADGIDLLLDPSVSFTIKRDVWRDHVEPIVHYLREQDLMPPEEKDEKKEEENEDHEQEQKDNEESPPDDNTPPPDEEAFQPSMDEMSKGKEGESSAFFTITPFYGGYFRQKTYSVWNEQSLSWEASPSAYEDIESETLDTLSLRVMSGSVRGEKPLSLPIPYGWSVEAATLETNAPKDAVRIERGTNGSVRMMIDAPGVYKYQIRLAKRMRVKRIDDQPTEKDSAFAGTLPDDLLQTIAETQKAAIPMAAKARTLIKYIRDHLTYSNDSSLNAIYRANPSFYFQKMWQEKKADCDVANTMAAAALRSAGIACRLVTGHFVKNKNKKNQALMTSGTGHAWLEVWDPDERAWFRADATPKGDPTLDEERPDEQQESGEGDYGDQEAEIMSEEKLEELMKKLDQAQEESEKPKTSEQRVEEKFAQQAECSVAEAQEVLAAFRRVREKRNEKGERIGEGLIREWSQLVRSRWRKAMEYTGPMRRSEGDELVDPVTMRLDRRAGDRNPSGYERWSNVEKREKLFGGIDIYIQIDRSGSMSEIDPVSGQRKCVMQADFALLYADTFMQCAVLSRQAEGRLAAPLPIRLQIVSIHGGASVDLPLCDQWGPKEQVALYRAVMRTAGGGTPDHEGLYIIEQRILAERELWKQKKHQSDEKPPIEFVAVSLDGGSDNAAVVRSALGRLRKLGAAVYGYGMTAAAKAVEVIYAPDGRTLVTLAQHAEIAARDTISVFKRLYPERVKR